MQVTVHASMASSQIPMSAAKVSICPFATHASHASSMHVKRASTAVAHWLCAIITWECELILFTVSAIHCANSASAAQFTPQPPCITAMRSFSLAPDIGLLFPDLMHAARPNCILIQSVAPVDTCSNDSNSDEIAAQGKVSGDFSPTSCPKRPFSTEIAASRTLPDSHVVAVLCVGFNTGQVVVCAARSIHAMHSTSEYSEDLAPLQPQSLGEASAQAAAGEMHDHNLLPYSRSFEKLLRSITVAPEASLVLGSEPVTLALLNKASMELPGPQTPVDTSSGMIKSPLHILAAAESAHVINIVVTRPDSIVVSRCDITHACDSSTASFDAVHVMHSTLVRPDSHADTTLHGSHAPVTVTYSIAAALNLQDGSAHISMYDLTWPFLVSMPLPTMHELNAVDSYAACSMHAHHACNSTVRNVPVATSTQGLTKVHSYFAVSAVHGPNACIPSTDSHNEPPATGASFHSLTVYGKTHSLAVLEVPSAEASGCFNVQPSDAVTSGARLCVMCPEDPSSTCNRSFCSGTVGSEALPFPQSNGRSAASNPHSRPPWHPGSAVPQSSPPSATHGYHASGLLHAAGGGGGGGGGVSEGPNRLPLHPPSQFPHANLYPPSAETPNSTPLSTPKNPPSVSGSFGCTWRPIWRPMVNHTVTAMTQWAPLQACDPATYIQSWPLVPATPGALHAAHMGLIPPMYGVVATANRYITHSDGCMRDAASLRDVFSAYGAESFLHIIGLRMTSRFREHQKQRQSGSSGSFGRVSNPYFGGGHTRPPYTSFMHGGAPVDTSDVHAANNPADSLDAAVVDSDPHRVTHSSARNKNSHQIVLEAPCDPQNCEIHSAHTLHVVIARNGAITAVCAHLSHLFVACSQMLWTYSVYGASSGDESPSGGMHGAVADGSKLRNLPTPSGAKILQPLVCMTVDSVANVLVATDAVHGVTVFRYESCVVSLVAAVVTALSVPQ